MADEDEKVESAPAQDAPANDAPAEPVYAKGEHPILDQRISAQDFLRVLDEESSPDRIYGRMLLNAHRYQAASLTTWRERVRALEQTPIEPTVSVVIGGGQAQTARATSRFGRRR